MFHEQMMRLFLVFIAMALVLKRKERCGKLRAVVAEGKFAASFLFLKSKTKTSTHRVQVFIFIALIDQRLVFLFLNPQFLSLS
jgi:hypothetical protein